MENSKAKSVVDFYVLCNRLKNLIRTGWTAWGVQRARVESVAEHVFGVQMLAISMWSQYKYNLDIQKVMLMLALHEMEEIAIGDLTQWDAKATDKSARGHAAIKHILKDLLRGDEIEALILEFDTRQTPEAKFAYNCDKLECDLQSKLYDEENCVDLTKQENNKAFHDPTVQELLGAGYSWSGMWMAFGRQRYPYDMNFREVSKYATAHNLLQKTKCKSKSK